MLPPNARTVAARVLERVERDQAYAAAALDAEIERSPQLDSRDRGLATEIVYGVLRTRGLLLARLGRRMPRGLPDDSVAVSHLLVATYQLLLLDRVPGHAAVDAAVSGIKAARGLKMAGFANAVLRKIAGRRLPTGRLARRRDRRRAPRLGLLAVRSNAPWARTKRARCSARRPESDSPRTRAVSVRVKRRTRRCSPRGSKEQSSVELRPWRASCPDPEESAESAKATRTACSRWKEEGAQVVACWLSGARPGEHVLDACAGRGSEKSDAAPRANRSGVRSSGPRTFIRRSSSRSRRSSSGWKLAPATAAGIDWRASGSARCRADFDRVLVDAPCTW